MPSPFLGVRRALARSGVTEPPVFGGLPNGDGVAPRRRERTMEMPREFRVGAKGATCDGRFGAPPFGPELPDRAGCNPVSRSGRCGGSGRRGPSSTSRRRLTPAPGRQSAAWLPGAAGMGWGVCSREGRMMRIWWAMGCGAVLTTAAVVVVGCGGEDPAAAIARLRLTSETTPCFNEIGRMRKWQ